MPTVDEVKRILREEMDNRGWHNNDWRAGLAAIVGGESRFQPAFEMGYSHTSNDRIRSYFSKTRRMSDEEINEIKSSDRTWFNFVYGGRFGNRPGTDDGFNYRGGGLNQLTFRDNYATYGPKVGVDLVAHPDMINVPRVAAAVAVEYMKDRFHGGDFNAQKAAVGVSIGGPDAEKNRLYLLYSRTGEWDYNPDAATPVPDAVGLDLDPEMAAFFAAYDNAAKLLKARKLYTGPIGDFDPGPGFRAGVKAYLRELREKRG